MTKLIGLRQLAATTDLDGARALAVEHGGYVLADGRAEWQHLPFRGLLVVSTDDIEAVAAVADVGHYVGAERQVRDGPMAVAGLFPLVHRPDLSRAQADGHWRDQHAPLALEHHRAMSHYTQLAVLVRLSGSKLDGFAVCGFGSDEDLRERFYSHPDSRQVIAADIGKFADLRNSPRRLVVQRVPG